MDKKCDRREFIQMGIAAGVAAKTSGLASAASKPVRLAVIGVGGRGTTLLRQTLKRPGIDIPALCDIDQDHLDRAIRIVEEAGRKRPVGFSDGEFDYRNLLKRDDVDAVLIGTPMQWHARMAVDALRAQKHVLSEVSAAVTLEECWDIVRAAEETDKIYMLSENCCYYRSNMMVLNMVQQGLFGDLTYAECGYVHDCRYINFRPDGSLTWRGELARDYIGNLYPTHSLGPIAKFLGINRGDRLVSLVAFTSRQAAIEYYAKQKFGKDHPVVRLKFAVGDNTTTLIRTANGVMIDLRYDTASPRPVLSTTYFGLQGTTASYDDRDNVQRIWIEGRSEGNTWDSLEKYKDEFDHPLWRTWHEEAEKTGHSGGDFFVIQQFIGAIRTGRPSPIDAYDAAAWSSITALSARSIRDGGKPQEIPDFTRGAWETRKPDALTG